MSRLACGLMLGSTQGAVDRQTGGASRGRAERADVAIACPCRGRGRVRTMLLHVEQRGSRRHGGAKIGVPFACAVPTEWGSRKSVQRTLSTSEPIYLGANRVATCQRSPQTKAVLPLPAGRQVLKQQRPAFVGIRRFFIGIE